MLLLFFITLKLFKDSESGGRNALGAAVFGALLLIAGHSFIEQSTVAEVFMLNLTFVFLIFLSLVHRKYCLAGFLAGVGLGNQHTLVLVFPAVLYIIFMGEKKKFKKLINFSIWILTG